MTLQELMDRTKEELEDPTKDYTATNALLGMVSKVGNISEFGLKRRRSQSGSTRVRDSVEEGDEKVQIAIGQLLWLTAAFAQRNNFDLDTCVEKAHAHQAAKRAVTPS